MRKLQSWKAVWLALFCSLFVMSASAQELSVRNKPYKGEMKGRGLDMLVRLDEMAKALDLPAIKSEAGWTLANIVIPTTEDTGNVYIKLSDLKVTGTKVTLNKDFNTIDVNRPVAKGNAAVASAGSGWTMVHFGANW